MKALLRIFALLAVVILAMAAGLGVGAIARTMLGTNMHLITIFVVSFVVGTIGSTVVFNFETIKELRW